MLQFLNESYVIGILTALVTDTPGKIFLLTVIAYLTGYLIYSSYLSWFTGGFGSVPFGPAGFNIIDVLSLFPLALITLLEILRKSWWPLLKKSLITLLRFLLPWGVGIVAAVLLMTQGYQIVPKSNLWSQVSYLIFILLWIVYEVVRVQDFKRRVLKSIICVLLLLLQIVAIFFMVMTASPVIDKPNSLKNLTIPLLITRILSDITVLIFMVVIFPGGLSLTGLTMAKRAILDETLSKVLRLSLKEPMPGIGTLQSESTVPQTSKRWFCRWFTQAAVPAETMPDVYTYLPERELYLIVVFSRNTLLYFPNEDPEVRGKALLVSNELIRGIEMESARSTSNEESR
jgi:hypothetical protein